MLRESAFKPIFIGEFFLSHGVFTVGKLYLWFIGLSLVCSFLKNHAVSNSMLV